VQRETASSDHHSMSCLPGPRPGPAPRVHRSPGPTGHSSAPTAAKSSFAAPICRGRHVVAVGMSPPSTDHRVWCGDRRSSQLTSTYSSRAPAAPRLLPLSCPVCDLLAAGAGGADVLLVLFTVSSQLACRRPSRRHINVITDHRSTCTSHWWVGLRYAPHALWF